MAPLTNDDIPKSEPNTSNSGLEWGYLCGNAAKGLLTNGRRSRPTSVPFAEEKMCLIHIWKATFHLPQPCLGLGLLTEGQQMLFREAQDVLQGAGEGPL